MALTNLNALGSSIRQKVGEAEKKTLPQLKDIVDNQLVHPQGELSVTTNGTYDVKSYASVNVATDERTPQDYKNAVDIASWNALFLEGTGTFSISDGMRAFTGDIPYIDASGYSTFTNAFFRAKAKSINIKFSEANTNFAGIFQEMSNLTELKISGSTRNVTNFGYAFSECKKLETIDGELDFSSATNLSRVFSSCFALNSINIKPNSISANNNFDFYYKSPKNIVLEMINGLAEVTSYHTTAFGSTVKINMGATETKASWWCKFVDGIYVDCNETDEGAISYASAITSKGWTIV